MVLEKQRLRKRYIIKLKPMSDKEIKEFIDKLDAGLKLAEERMLKEKSLKGENVVVYTEEKGIQHIPASQIIAEKILN